MTGSSSRGTAQQSSSVTPSRRGGSGGGCGTVILTFLPRKGPSGGATARDRCAGKHARVSASRRARRAQRSARHLFPRKVRLCSAAAETQRGSPPGAVPARPSSPAATGDTKHPAVPLPAVPHQPPASRQPHAAAWTCSERRASPHQTFQCLPPIVYPGSGAWPEFGKFSTQSPSQQDIRELFASWKHKRRKHRAGNKRLYSLKAAPR